MVDVENDKLISSEQTKDIRSIIGKLVFDAGTDQQTCIERAEAIKSIIDEMIKALKGQNNGRK